MNGIEWVMSKQNRLVIARLREAGIPRVLAAVLASRGMKDPEAVKTFLSYGGEFYDPFLFKDMEKAVARITKALDDKEKITVYGDFDADGVTATAVMYTYLKSRGAEVDYYIPQRESEGYGLNADAVRKLAAAGTKLIVTVDTGISAFEEAKLAKELGVSLVVTDHHEPRGELPEADAVVDAKQEGCNYPFKELAGVGVAAKLVGALEPKFNPQRVMAQYGAFLCLGTVADIVPLVGENRRIVRGGLKIVSAGSNCGIDALLEVAGAKGKRMTAQLLSFTAAPRINACGRMESAETALKLLIEKDHDTAIGYARILDENNRQRRETELEIYEKAVKKVEESDALRNSPVLIVSGEDWHTGVIGIVASRLMERYGKPAIVVSFSGDEGRASCRSMKGFNIHEALCETSQYLERFGGHELAAGFSIKRENYDAFYKALLHSAEMHSELPHLTVHLDCSLTPREVSLSTAREVRDLEPCGNGNEEPLFYLPNAQILGITPVGVGHVRLTMSYGGFEFRAILFGAEKKGFDFAENDIVDLAVTLDVNVFRNAEYLDVCVKQIRKSTCFEYYRSLYEKFTSGKSDAPKSEETSVLKPVRGEFASVYRYLRAHDSNVSLETMCKAVRRIHPTFNYFKLRLCIDVFRETGLLSDGRVDDDNMITYKLNDKIKVDINASALLARL